MTVEPDFNPVKKAEELAKGFVDFVREVEARHAIDRKPAKQLLTRGTIEVYNLNEGGQFMATFKADQRQVEINGKTVPSKPKSVNGLGHTPLTALESLVSGMINEKVIA